MYFDNKGFFHVNMFCFLNSDIMFWFHSNDKDYAKYVSIILNRSKKLNHALQLVKDTPENEKLNAKK